MNYKVQKTLKDNKKSLIVIGVLWLILVVILVSPIAYSIAQASSNGIFDGAKFFEEIIPAITSFTTITKEFSLKL